MTTGGSHSVPTDPLTGSPRAPDHRKPSSLTSVANQLNVSSLGARAAKRERQVLVTGGLGFIGSFVSENLAARGHHVTVVDSGVASVVEVNELDAGPGSFGYVPQDVVTFLKQRGSLGEFDLVVHCASFVGPSSILCYTGKIAPAIITTTAHLVEACIEADVPLINFSSAEVYGKSGMLFEGSDIPIPSYYNARIEYALGKLSAEAMCYNNRERGLRSVTLRPFNVAGPRQSRFGGLEEDSPMFARRIPCQTCPGFGG